MHDVHHHCIITMQCMGTGSHGHGTGTHGHGTPWALHGHPRARHAVPLHFSLPFCLSLNLSPDSFFLPFNSVTLSLLFFLFPEITIAP
jgi:hypothetical protein